MIPVAVLILLYLGFPAGVVLLVIAAVLHWKGNGYAPAFLATGGLCLIVTAYFWYEISQVNFGL